LTGGSRKAHIKVMTSKPIVKNRYNQLWRDLSQSGARQKNYGKILYFELATVMSQALKCDVINFCQHV